MSKIPLAVLIAAVGSLPCVAAAQQPAPKVIASYTSKPGDDACISPSGRLLARVSNRTLFVLDLARHTTHTIANVPAWEISWAPKEDGIVFVRGDDAGEGEYIWYAGVDPNTGAARGVPRRVSVAQGDQPALSHDGKWVAYGATDKFPDVTLTVVPATGGPGRVLTHVDHGFDGTHWSGDDRTIFFGGPTEDGWEGVEKISVAGGPPTHIGAPRQWLPGMTQDRRFIITVPAVGETGEASRGSVMDTTGKVVGTFALPPHEVSEYDEVVGDSGLVWVQIVDHKTIALRPVGGGSAKHLPLLGRTDVYPTWSPDSRKVAFLARRGGNYTLVTANADGSDLHEFTTVSAAAGERAIAWSPDAASIAYIGANRHSVWRLDLHSGLTKKLFDDPGHTPGQLRWRTDGRSIAFVGGVQPAGSRASVEIQLGGTWKELGRTARAGRVIFADDHTLAFRTDSTQGFATLDFREVGPSVTVPRGQRTWMPAISRDGRTIVTPITYQADKRRNSLEIVDTATRTNRMIDLPFVLDPRVRKAGLIGSDHTALLVAMQHSNDSTSKLYAVPLDGGQPRIIDDVGYQPLDASASASPDGKYVAYTVQPTPTTENLLLLPLPAAARRTSRSTPR